MPDFKSDFAPSSLPNWIDQLKKDLNEIDFQKLYFTDELEELSFQAFQNSEIAILSPTAPGEFPYLRGIQKTNNSWTNGILIHEKNPKNFNGKALNALMTGADALYINLTSLPNDYQTAFDQIGFEYIHANFILSKKEEFQELMDYFNSKLPLNCWIHFDYLQDQDNETFRAIVQHLKNQQFPAFLVNGYELQQCGATSWQEIAFCLSTGHEYLSRLLKNGLTIDEAAACIHFKIGIGSNYLIEIAKIRVLRVLWAQLIKAYSPVHECSCAIQLGAVIGTMNKSLRDPNTNLLRQTTEAMSAIAGGIKQILVLPHDSHAENGPSELAQRMAINISLLLQEESYFTKVIDPLGGSYVLEGICKELSEKAWTYFQQLEKLGGTFATECLNNLQEEILKKQKQRIEQLKSGSKILIGVNKYQLSNSSDIKIVLPASYLNLPTLNYEFELLSAE